MRAKQSESDIAHHSQPLKFAAIDIGSNAVRLLLANVFEDRKNVLFKKDALVRMPLRLGAEVFRNGRLSEAKAEALVNTMVGFRYLMDSQKPLAHKACATSAMREAANGREVIARIQERAGIAVQIIGGQQEAELLYENHIAEKLNNKAVFLYIDVGGGSTEITLFSENRRVTSSSFNVGTVRLLEKLVVTAEWERMRDWVKTITVGFNEMGAIGTGGNINKLFELSHLREGKPLPLKKLREINNFLKSIKINDRITVLGLKPDRADVIIPAAEIYLSIMKWAKINKVYVPQVGLADGIIHTLYEQHRQQSTPQ